MNARKHALDIVVTIIALGIIAALILSSEGCILFTGGLQAETVMLTRSWTAPGDDDYEGIVSGYDLRYTTDTLLSFDQWSAVNVNPCDPICDTAGTFISVEFWLDLIPEVNYWFAIKAVDNAQNWSPISNFVRVNLDDVTPPGYIGDFQ